MQIRSLMARRGIAPFFIEKSAAIKWHNPRVTCYYYEYIAVVRDLPDGGVVLCVL